MQACGPFRVCRGLFFPLLLIALGVIFLANQFHWFYISSAFSYFLPVVFILFGLELLTSRPRGGRKFWGVVAVAVGAAMVLRNLGYIPFDIGNLWPLLLIAAGVALLFGGIRPRRRDFQSGLVEPGPAPDFPGDDSVVDSVAILGGAQRRITAQNFAGGRIFAFFGGFQLDLSRAGIAGPQAVLDLSALFGGGEVRVPENWIIDIQAQALFGAYTDETHQLAPSNGAKRLVVQGYALFGGVVIKN